MRAVIIVGFLAALFLTTASQAKADGIRFAKDPAYLTFSGGWFDINRQKDQGGEFSLEYRHNQRFLLFKPFLHAAVTTPGHTFLGAGVLIDVQLGDNWIVQPSFAPVWYRGQTDELDLGYGLEFRSRLEIAYRFRDKSRLGFSFSHTSNAGLGDVNPGTESLMVNVSVPIGMLGN